MPQRERPRLIETRNYKDFDAEIFLYDMSNQPWNNIKVTGHPFWRFMENRYCALKIRPIFIKFSPNVSQCMQNMIKL